MKLNHLAALAAFTLAACSQDNGVRLTHEEPVATPAPAVAAKVEPVFYNGKTYKVSITPNGDGTIAMKIPGMGANQEKDAAALSSNVLHHFACKDSQKAVLSAPPAFDGTGWFAAGRCA
jgi:hypothetical protein